MKLLHPVASVAFAFAAAAAIARSSDALSSLSGRFDNHAQVAHQPRDAKPPIPHVTVTIEPTARKDWSLWHVDVQTGSGKYDQTWAMQRRTMYDGSSALIPYYELHQTKQPKATAFDPEDWLSLEACALRGDPGKVPFRAISEGAPCVAVTLGIGARRALLPVGIDYQADSLRLAMDLLGERMQIDAKREAAG